MAINESLYELFTIPNKWAYRGEGNCNLVISLPKSKEILRIRKTEQPKSLFGWILVLITDFLQWYCGKGFIEETRDIKFYSKVMRPLLSFEYTSESKLVLLNRKQVQILKDDLIKYRPIFRQFKTLQYSRAALFNDFAYLPQEFDGLEFNGDTYSVEIKPKQGWRPLKEQIYTECLFCMNQYLKLDKNRIKNRTKYCPEELFSGDKFKMVKALKNLLEIPQNNIKIFKNGLVVYDDKKKNSLLEILREIFQSNDSLDQLNEEFCTFLQKCLTTKIGATILENNHRCLNNSCSSKKIDSSNNLPKDSVLEKILSVQMLDDEGTHSTYKKLTKSGENWSDFSFVDKFLENLDNFQDYCSRCKILEAAKTCENELIFLPYLISAIAKDCSLMITFRKLKNEPHDPIAITRTFHTSYGHYFINIGIFDLYPKPLSTIQKHYTRNKEMCKALKKINLS